jgi:hypothetical protein
MFASSFFHNITYGVEGRHVGDVVVIDIKPPDVAPHFRPQVFFVVDTSGSMRFNGNPMDNAVKPTLLALKDLIAGVDEATDEQLAAVCDLTLISFNTDVRVLWSSSTRPQSYECSVLSIFPDGKTNMGGAVVESLKMVDPSRPSWILVFTDGETNAGEYLSPTDFGGLACWAPPLCKIMTFGYGDQFNAQTCSALGHFTHIENQDKIAGIMGAVVGDIVHACFQDVRFFEDDSVVPVIGMRKIQSIPAGKNMRVAFKFSTAQDAYTAFNRDHQIRYYDLSQRNYVWQRIGFSLPDAKEYTASLREDFYLSSAGALIRELFLYPSPTMTEQVATEISDWTEMCSLDARSKVEQTLATVARPRGCRASAISLHSFSSGALTQTSYSDEATYTPIQRFTSALSITRAKNYSQSAGHI